MQGLRRAIVALLLGALVATVLRLLGNSTNPSEHGGWRELAGPELR